jgi:hypothetical protein
MASLKDRAIPAGLPKAFRGQNQIDGSETNMLMGGTKSLQPRAPAPNGAQRSGMENAMGTQADQLHPNK